MPLICRRICRLIHVWPIFVIDLVFASRELWICEKRASSAFQASSGIMLGISNPDLSTAYHSSLPSESITTHRLNLDLLAHITLSPGASTSGLGYQFQGANITF